MTADKTKSASGKSLEGGEDGYVRLHISPFDANLFGVVVPSAAAPQARNISYHEIETFPERRYGYVELPVADAEKIRKKLNGATLKGAKMKIEKARPESRPEPTGEEPKKKMKEKKIEAESEEPNKRKRDRALEGVSLGDRKVKRGWTDGPTDYKKKTKKDRESKSKDDKRTQQKSKYTESPECLFKTRVPPNATGNIVVLDEEEAKRTKKKKKGNSRDVVVHEFEKTTKFPSFLKMSSVEKKGKEAAEYVPGKGWVDEDGNVVQEVKEKVIPKPEKKSKKSVKIAEVSEESDSDTSSSGSSTSADDSDSEDEDIKMEDQVIPAKEPVQINSESKDASSSSESDSESDNSDSSDSSDDEDSPTKQPNKSAVDASSVTSPERPNHIDIPPLETPQTAVHPLEALYKRDKDGKAAHADDDAAVAAPGGFSFFGADLEEDEENDVVETTLMAPMTPYTKQDFEFRNVRSAAPTPDTSKKTTFWGGEDDEDDVNDLYADDDEDGPVATSASSDFQKWFWENRGDLNRSWMTRRKTAAKEKRHRDNKARASKA